MPPVAHVDSAFAEHIVREVAAAPGGPPKSPAARLLLSLRRYKAGEFQRLMEAAVTGYPGGTARIDKVVVDAMELDWYRSEKECLLIVALLVDAWDQGVLAREGIELTLSFLDDGRIEAYWPHADHTNRLR